MQSESLRPTCPEGYDGTGRVGTLGVLAHIVQALQHPAREEGQSHGQC